MKFIWSNDRKSLNQELTFIYECGTACNELKVAAADGFRIFFDDVLISYGPERTLKGHARVREVGIPVGVKHITVKTVFYGVPTFTYALQEPFFGAEILQNGKVVADTLDFKCYVDGKKLQSVQKFSNQRGFLEVYDYSKNVLYPIKTKEVEAPVLLPSHKDNCLYDEEAFNFIKRSVFNGFDKVDSLWWEPAVEKKIGVTDYLVQRDMLDTINGFNAYDFDCDGVKTGFLKIRVKSKNNVRLIAVLEETLPDGKWIFRRSACNDYVEWKLPSGEYELLSAEPYSFKFVKVLTDSEVELSVSVVKVQNDAEAKLSLCGDEKIQKVFDSAINTYRQNTFDIFMDCPGRERAGWLCDSYFTGITERFFFGNNDIETNFLENFLLIDTANTDKVILPMCFPSDTDSLFIPNWSMWFVLEVLDYYKRTGNYDFIIRAKEKIYKIVNYFADFKNEYGLLENLDGWVFVEWSICNNEEYVKGVNFPTNMLYAKMLETVDDLYGDESLKKQAEDVRKAVVDFSFNGEFFAENAVRVNGKLIRCDTHLSETCQYYALFTDTVTDESFCERVINELGPLNAVKPNVGKSNVFIGYYLRFILLLKRGEYDRVIDEAVKLFEPMANNTKTLWENDSPASSCNHGFASVIAVWIAESIMKSDKRHGVKITIKEETGEKIIEK